MIIVNADECVLLPGLQGFYLFNSLNSVRLLVGETDQQLLIVFVSS